ncbi:hypothetical protein Noda2021_00270 [Candidatus Dependentiae bacterium Noda2021]|nr:hypothetical protein Noda2021_00270 [Candidatus Dependentiae bacterium Noda2021]
MKKILSLLLINIFTSACEKAEQAIKAFSIENIKYNEMMDADFQGPATPRIQHAVKTAIDLVKKHDIQLPDYCSCKVIKNLVDDTQDKSRYFDLLRQSYLTAMNTRPVDYEKLHIFRLQLKDETAGKAYGKLNTIFISNILNDEHLTFLARHEVAHIAHKHYLQDNLSEYDKERDADTTATELCFKANESDIAVNYYLDAYQASWDRLSDWIRFYNNWSAPNNTLYPTAYERAQIIKAALDRLQTARPKETTLKELAYQIYQRNKFDITTIKDSTLAAGIVAWGGSFFVPANLMLACASVGIGITCTFPLIKCLSVAKKQYDLYKQKLL